MVTPKGVATRLPSRLAGCLAVWPPFFEFILGQKRIQNFRVGGKCRRKNFLRHHLSGLA